MDPPALIHSLNFPILFSHFFHLEVRGTFTNDCESQSLIEDDAASVDF